MARNQNQLLLFFVKSVVQPTLKLTTLLIKKGNGIKDKLTTNG